MRKPHPRKPDPEVMEADHRIPAALGSAAWAVALIALVASGDALPPEKHWWIWVCATGLALGLLGYVYIPRLLRKRAEEAERHTTTREAAEREPT